MFLAVSGNCFRRKFKMKKTLALLLCLAMLFTALTVNVFADENPTVTIETSSVSENGATSFAINLAGFESLKGYDLVVEAGAGLILDSASALNAKTELNKDVNYTVTKSGDKLHIVELAGEATGDIITVKANFDKDCKSAVEVKVTACDLAKSGSELYKAVTADKIAPVSIAPYVAPTTEVKNEATTVKQPVNAEESDVKYFIPYGAVYTGDDNNPTYVPKNKNGDFAVDVVGTVVKTFKVPEGGFGTFGVSDAKVSDFAAKQFGNVETNYDETKSYGTLVMAGEWADFKDWYLSKKGYSDAVLVQKIYNAFETANPVVDVDGKREYEFITFKAGDAIIKVYNVAQKNYMWKSGKTFEYAVRLYGLVGGTEYATVAYNTNGTTAKFAQEIKSIDYQG